MIQRVVLQNWRSHKSTELEFSKGTNVLVGIMGSGKSSVLEAVCFALYGTFPALLRRKIRLGQVASAFSAGGDVSVEAVIEKNGSTYSIRRTINNGKGDAELRENGKLIETKSEAVTRLVEHILGVDYDLYTKAVYAEQNSLDYFFSLSPADRKKQIDELIGLDRFERGRAGAQRIANRLARDAAEIESRIQEGERGRIENEMRGIDGKIAGIVVELNSLGEKAKVHAEDEARLKKELEMLDRLRTRLDSLSRIKIGMEAEMNGLAERIRGHTSEELSKKENEMRVIESELKKIKSNIESMRSESSKVSGEIGESRGIIAAVGEKRGELDAIGRRLYSMGAVRTTANIDMEIAECEKLLMGHERELASLMKEKELAGVELAKEKEKIECAGRLKEELNGVRHVLKRSVEEKMQVKESTISWIATLEEVLRAAQESIGRLSSGSEAVCPLCESELSKERRAKLISEKKLTAKNTKNEIEAKRKELEEVSAEIGALEAKLRRREEIEAALKEAEGAENRRDELTALISSMTGKINGLQKNVAEERARFAALKNELENARDKEALVKKSLEIESFIAAHAGAEERLAKALEPRARELEEGLRSSGEALAAKEREAYGLKSLCEKMRDDIELQGMRDRLGKELEKISSEIGSLGYNEERHSAVRDKLNEARISNRESELLLSALKGELELAKRNLALLKERADEMRKREEEAAELRDAQHIAAAMQKSISETQVRLRAELIGSVNSILGRIWGKVYPYSDFSDVRVDANESDYVIMANRHGEWIAIEGNVSGGERASMALALRVAFSIVLAPRMGMLMLDEPTHNLDENGVKALGEIFREKLPGIVGQAFVITHDEQLREGASGRLYTFTRDKAGNAPTCVSPDFA